MNDEPTRDIDLVAALDRGLERVERLPDRALAAAYGAVQLANVDAELAGLVYDSLLEPAGALIRGDEGETRIITFANDHLSLDVALLGDGTTIVGEIDPAEAYEVELETVTNERVTILVDQFGRFRATTDANSFRLRVLGHLVSPWITR